jgi:hypothetical protein
MLPVPAVNDVILNPPAELVEDVKPPPGFVIVFVSVYLRDISSLFLCFSIYLNYYSCNDTCFNIVSIRFSAC